MKPRLYPYIFTTVLIFSFHQVSCREYDKSNRDQVIEQIIESMIESAEEEINSSMILEDLTRYAEKPLRINSATAGDLSHLHIFTYNQIINIISYRDKYGSILSKYELQAIEGVTKVLADLADPFISYLPRGDEKEDKNRGRLRNIYLTKAQINLPVSKGYFSEADSLQPAYPGPPAKFYGRYRCELDNVVSAGFTFENDAGESLFSGSNRRGFDYYSGFLTIKNIGLLEQITIGDYRLGFGQGVSINSGYGIGKSSNVLNVIKGVQGVRPYTSTDENNFFRGIAAEMSVGRLRLTGFFSGKKRDANIVCDTTDHTVYFTSLQSSGYHRNLNETDDEKSLGEKIFGIYTELNFTSFRVGILSACQRFDYKMRSITDYSYKKFGFTGSEKINLGIDYQLGLSGVQFFGELAMGENLKFSGVQGLSWNPHPVFGLSALYRYFAPEFYSIYGNSFSESSGNNNERGLYTGVQIIPVDEIKLSLYSDLFYFPWLRYNTIAPGQGSDLFFQVDYIPGKNLEFCLKRKKETKPSRGEINQGIPMNVEETRENFRLNSIWRLSEKLTLRWRGEYVKYNKDDRRENGYLTYGDLVISMLHAKTKLWLRYSVFNTSGYNSRIYAYENDVLYSFYIPSYYGKGHRMYINFKYNTLKMLTMYLKIGHTIRSGTEEWGSGNDITYGNNRTDIKAMLRWSF